ncbi:hypothetical protein EJ02DRAFT_398531 [Clathrospora elynae]|uniref:Uncharacterized protein n=1 Tax=Clathrospora elynae TaxID=706981 RepID=A0A6A5SVV3_9PLEO|nr:hypothetical protein EJ02DRAFT_398531 [Clathrospora elynae]
MIYLIHTKEYPRPFLTTLPFVARDFSEWGFRVDRHTTDSAYIAEIRPRERNTRTNRTEWRVEVMEMWAREVLCRKREERNQCLHAQPQRATDENQAQEDCRFERACKMMQDFVEGLAAFGECGCAIPKYFLDDKKEKPVHPGGKHGTKHTNSPQNLRLISPYPLRLISKYMCLLQAVRYISNATLPAWSNPDITRADQITMEFMAFKAVQKEHLVHAVNRAICKSKGMMGRVERDTRTGVTRVMLFVDVGDCYLDMGSEDAETRDPVPVYERGERSPVYVDGI